MKRNVIVLFSISLCLIFFVVTFLFIEFFNTGRSPINRENNFQHVVHGVGIGATTKPTWCYINFDPRIDPRCPCIEWPIPGGYCYCPDHTGSISYIAGNVEMGAAIEIIKNHKTSNFEYHNLNESKE